MAAKPTTLAELRSHQFLRKRVDALTEALLTSPDDAALWVGAGLSAKYAGLPTWTRFLRTLLESCVPHDSKDFALIANLIDSGRLAIAAECIHDLTGSKIRDALISQLDGRTARLADEIAYLGIRDVITTNYDMMLESSLCGYQALLPSSGLANLLSNEFKIVKIHGSVAIPDSCVLSLTNYVRAYNVNLYWYLASVFSTSSVAFLGCSMNPSEPYFEVLRILRATGRMKGRHFAVVPVESNEAAKTLGQRLSQFEIALIPYIADDQHTFLDELLGHLESHRGSSTNMLRRLGGISKDLKGGRGFRAGLRLWHASHAHVTGLNVRQGLADVVAEFFSATLGRGEPSDHASFVAQCFSAGIDCPQMMLRTLDLIGTSSRTVNAFYKLKNVFPNLERAVGMKLPLLARKFAELGHEIAVAKKTRLQALPTASPPE